MPNILSVSTTLEEPLNSLDYNPVFAVLRRIRTVVVPPSLVSSHSHSSHLCDWSGTPVVKICQLYTKPLQHSWKYLQNNMPPLVTLLLNPDLIDHLLPSVTSLLLSSSSKIPVKVFHLHRVPGWNSSHKAASLKCKRCYVPSLGGPWIGSDPACSVYREAKKHFHACLRWHRKSSAERCFASLDSSISDCFFHMIRKHSSDSHSSHT